MCTVDVRARAFAPVEVASRRGLRQDVNFAVMRSSGRDELGRIPRQSGLPLRSRFNGDTTRSLSPHHARPRDSHPRGCPIALMSPKLEWRPHRAIQPGSGAGPVYMRAVSKTGARPSSSCERDGLAIGDRDIQENLTGLRIGDQCRQNEESGDPVVGGQRPDLVSAPAEPNGTPGGRRDPRNRGQRRHERLDNPPEQGRVRRRCYRPRPYQPPTPSRRCAQVADGPHGPEEVGRQGHARGDGP